MPNKTIALLCGFVLLISLFVPGLGLEAPAGGETPMMCLLAFNVGKADCLLLRCGESLYMIDTGRGNTWDTVEEGLTALKITHLDGVIITHMDSDHVGGLKKLLKSDIQVDHIYISPFYTPEKDDKEENPAVKRAKNAGREAEILQAGTEIQMDGGTLRVIGPLLKAGDKDDNNSLILYAEAGGAGMLLAGDMEFPEEETLLRAGVIPRADVLKIGNHGDGDATSNAFLEMVRPRIGVISTSTEEKESTPAPRVLRILETWNVDVYQTQEARCGILVTLREGDVSAIRVNQWDEAPW